MSLLHKFFKTILDALFPVSLVEQELFSYSPEEAFAILPPAPPVPIEAISLFAYKDERVAKLVWNIKYKKSAAAVTIAGYALHNALQKNTPHCTILLIPMPITARRRRERGFNQCELLVDEIARRDISRGFIIEKNLLVRTQHTSRHTLKNRQDRLTDAKGIFAVNEVVREKITTDALVIVIDDVITTGSTLKEAMETLRSSGFKNVQGMSVAH